MLRPSAARRSAGKHPGPLLSGALLSGACSVALAQWHLLSAAQWCLLVGTCLVALARSVLILSSPSLLDGPSADHE